MNRKYSDIYTKEGLASDLEEGLTLIEIAKKRGGSTHNVGNYIKYYGLPYNRLKPNFILLCGDYAKIRLGKAENNDCVIVDLCDLEKISQYKWSLTKSQTGEKYAAMSQNSVAKNRFGRKQIMLHRFILDIWDTNIFVDHIDGDGLNDRRNNIRPCNRSQNAANSQKPMSNQSGFRGVSKYKDKYKVRIRLNGEDNYLGMYDDIVSAAIAYNNKATELFGEFARLNIVPEDLDETVE